MEYIAVWVIFNTYNWVKRHIAVLYLFNKRALCEDR